LLPQHYRLYFHVSLQQQELVNTILLVILMLYFGIGHSQVPNATLDPYLWYARCHETLHPTERFRA
jgi:hypothetical protein